MIELMNKITISRKTVFKSNLATLIMLIDYVARNGHLICESWKTIHIFNTYILVDLF